MAKKNIKTLWIMTLSGKLTLTEVEVLKETEKQYQFDKSVSPSRVHKDAVNARPRSACSNARFYSSREEAITLWEDTYLEKAKLIKEVLLQIRSLKK
jgi:hypothetical protein